MYYRNSATRKTIPARIVLAARENLWRKIFTNIMLFVSARVAVERGISILGSPFLFFCARARYSIYNYYYSRSFFFRFLLSSVSFIWSIIFISPLFFFHTRIFFYAFCVLSFPNTLYFLLIFYMCVLIIRISFYSTKLLHLFFCKSPTRMLLQPVSRLGRIKFFFSLKS